MDGCGDYVARGLRLSGLMHRQSFVIPVLFALLAHVAVAALPQTARANDAHVASERQVHAPRDRSDRSSLSGPWSFEGKWYGWQTLTSDAVSAAVVVAVLNENPWDDTALTTVFAVGAVGFGLGPATIHALHGNWGVGVMSPLIRLLTLGFAFGREMARHSDLCDGETRECSDSALPSIALVLAGPIFDAVFAWEGRDVRPPTPGLQVSALALRDGAFVGISNTF